MATIYDEDFNLDAEREKIHDSFVADEDDFDEEEW